MFPFPIPVEAVGKLAERQQWLTLLLLVLVGLVGWLMKQNRAMGLKLDERTDAETKRSDEHRKELVALAKAGAATSATTSEKLGQVFQQGTEIKAEINRLAGVARCRHE